MRRSERNHAATGTPPSHDVPTTASVGVRPQTSLRRSAGSGALPLGRDCEPSDNVEALGVLDGLHELLLRVLEALVRVGLGLGLGLGLAASACARGSG